MRPAVEFLAELRRLVPPDIGNHGLLLQPDGQFIAVVRHHRIGQTFFLDDSDLVRDPASLAAEVKEIIDRNFYRQKQ